MLRILWIIAFILVLTLVVTLSFELVSASISDGLKTGGLADIVRDGYGSKIEALAVRELEKLTGEKLPSVRPGWLVHNGAQLELDGFNGTDLAIEFQGPLHTRWEPIEPYERYAARVARDAFKVAECERRGVTLVVVDYRLGRDKWHHYMSSRLFDAQWRGSWPKPYPYIDKMTVTPFTRELYI